MHSQRKPLERGLIGGFAGRDRPDGPGEMAGVRALAEDGVCLRIRDHKAIADPEVEGVPEIAFRNVSGLLEPIE